MKIFLCFCFLCFSFSLFAQQDSSTVDREVNRDSLLTLRRDSIITSFNKESSISKVKIEAVLSAFSQAADDMLAVGNNVELSDEEKSVQLRAIADQRDATLKSMLTDTQIAKVKDYIIRHKIPRKRQ